MDAIDERPTIAERYSVAADGTYVNDPDMLIAAGWCAERLGVMLLRLRGEFDNVKAEMDAYKAQQEALEATAEAERASVNVGPTRENWYRQEAGRESLTAHLLILAQLKTLREAKEALGDLAMKQAAVRNALPIGPMPLDVSLMDQWRTAADKRARTIATLAGKVLSAFLDPNCYPCNGVGKIGGYGAIQSVCRACGGSAKARNSIGNTDDQHQFAGHLMGLVERAVSQAERGIAGNLQDARAVRKMVDEVTE